MKIINLFIFITILYFSPNLSSAEPDFDQWKKNFKIYALEKGISQGTLNKAIDNTKFLPDVIKYDRYQPEFYEDTKTYIKKRTSNQKIMNGKKLFYQNKNIINNISNKYLIDKNLLLSLMGIETNFGKYLGKMDILSSLATLSFDQRRSDFFTSELITLLKLIDSNKVDLETLYGSWAGAFGNFQFMPTTINDYAIDYNLDKKVDLKNIEDSFASAANYLNSLGWNNEIPCFFKIKLVNKIPLDYLNTSAKNIHSKKKVKYFKQYIANSNFLDDYDELNSAIVTPDVDIVPDTNKFSPAYIVFDNYELILKWNRSLRFGLAVCTLREKFKNEL
tara:strand:+ start:769 stop:1767 length:999 start_codon:yes stop_codon:yes gene_type:complete